MKRFWCFFFIFWPTAAVVACWFAPQMNWWFPYNRGSATPLGARIDDLFELILWITTLTFIATQAALVYVLFRGARESGERALFTHGSHNLEVMWTIVPAGILLFIALYQMDVWAEYRIQKNFPTTTAGTPIIDEPIAEVTARQFEWRIRYPAPGRKFDGPADVQRWLREPEPGDLHAVNDLRVPAGQDVLIYLRTQDVQHSFFVPELRVKQDAVPGKVIPIWFHVNNATYDHELGGVAYEWVCAELCGWGHYKMGARLVAANQGDFDEYLKRLAAEQNDDGYRD
ncbi:MAG: cytochrome c oxidase subunit II [Planctomycetales bacterium]